MVEYPVQALRLVTLIRKKTLVLVAMSRVMSMLSL